MAKIYIRRKEAGKGWRYRAVPKVGRLPETKGAKFHVRYRDASGRFVWSQPYDTLDEARKEAAGLELNAKAVSLGLTVKEYENSKNSHRTTVKAAVEHFVSDAKKTKKRTTAAEYERNLRQFENSLRGLRFIDEITKKTLCDFRDFLAAEHYEPRTLHNRLLLILMLLKANGIKIGFSLVRDLPQYEEEPAVPYEPDELKRLFAAMDEEETTRYKFFLGTACREQEVMYASWQDVDSARGIYHIRAKSEVGFTPKKHESRDVKMPTELVELLKKRKKHAPHQRWIFINGGGKPEGHFLEKLKRIALRAKVNCGNCVAHWTEGRHPTRKIEVTCKTHPVCGYSGSGNPGRSVRRRTNREIRPASAAPFPPFPSSRHKATRASARHRPVGAMTCPTCSRSVHQSELITNVRTWEQFCLNCASRVCPSFLPHYVLTTDDCVFLIACGINPEVTGIEDALKIRPENPR